MCIWIRIYIYDRYISFTTICNDFTWKRSSTHCANYNQQIALLYRIISCRTRIDRFIITFIKKQNVWSNIRLIDIEYTKNKKQNKKQKSELIFLHQYSFLTQNIDKLTQHFGHNGTSPIVSLSFNHETISGNGSPYFFVYSK